MIWLSPVLLEIFAEGANCAIGVSGGKDSQALLITIVTWFRAQDYTGKIFAIFADLGRAEWLQTRSFIEQLCQSLQIKLVVVHRAQGDLLDLIEQRRATLDDTTLSFNHWVLQVKGCIVLQKSPSQNGKDGQKQRCSPLSMPL